MGNLVGVNRVCDGAMGIADSVGIIRMNYVCEPLVSADDKQQQIIIFELDFSRLKQFNNDFSAYLNADGFKLDWYSVCLLSDLICLFKSLINIFR